MNRLVFLFITLLWSFSFLMLCSCSGDGTGDGGINNETTPDGEFQDISIQSTIEHVQPMTGIVLWSDSNANNTDAIQLEYSYVKYADIVSNEGQYNWQVVENLLDQVALRKHQAILRFYYVYPGQATTVPQYLKDNPLYQETSGQSEGQTTWFPDWSFAGLESLKGLRPGQSET